MRVLKSKIKVKQMGDEPKSNYRAADCCEHCEHYGPPIINKSGYVEILISGPKCMIGVAESASCLYVCDEFTRDKD